MASINTIKSKLRRIVAHKFPGADLKLVNGSSVGKLAGTLIWKGFVGKDQIDRQRMLRKVLTGLPADDRQKLGGVFTLTPEEMEAISESSRER